MPFLPAETGASYWISRGTSSEKCGSLCEVEPMSEARRTHQVRHNTSQAVPCPVECACVRGSLHVSRAITIVRTLSLTGTPQSGKGQSVLNRRRGRGPVGIAQP